MKRLPELRQTPAARSTLRPEIQGLRALAVLLVVGYHLWPGQLQGGYVGVDVFFVISGFLMTSHIWRSTESGSFRFAEFYARRVRRLLPASLVVLGVVGVITLLLVPQTLWASYGRQILASTFYVQNWQLSLDAVDYSAAAASATPVQHFWSLSVEEQYYLFWPILLVVIASTVRLRPTLRRRALSILLLVTLVLSLTVSIVWTRWDQSTAYFVTPTRVWEFAAGGLIVVLPALNLVWARVAASWLGLLAILASAIFFTANTSFPGWIAAIPVIATALVVWSGNPISPLSPSLWYRWRPIQFIGDISYSLYLWHWPLIVLAPIVFVGVGYKVPFIWKLAIFVASLFVAWLSKRFIEDRFRDSPRTKVAAPLAKSGVFLRALAGMLIVSIFGIASVVVSADRMDAAKASLSEYVDSSPDCFGAAELDRECKPERVLVQPDPIIAPQDVAEGNCQQTTNSPEVKTCQWHSADPTDLRFAVVGDSHATQWLPAIRAVADRYGASVTTYLKSNCPFTSAHTVAQGSSGSCDIWNASVAQQLSTHAYSIVFTSGSSNTRYVAGGSQSAQEEAVAGLLASWSKVAPASMIVAIADTPRPEAAGLQDPPSCVLEKGPDSCNFGRSASLRFDPQKTAATSAPRVSLIDMSDSICEEKSCESVVGNVLVYRDSSHLTATYSSSLWPTLERKLQGFSDLAARLRSATAE